MVKTPEEIKHSRPISPHLTIYKPQINSITSIGHRLSGIGLFFALTGICWWFILWVFSKFNPCYLDFLTHSMVKLILFLVSYAFFYHLCSGIRHLIWDTGNGFSVRAIDYSGWVVIASSVILTAILWGYLLI